MKINNATVNINTNLSKIETLLLDFEQFPQTEILLAIRSEIQTVIQKMRKYFQLKNTLAMLNEFVIIISAAIEREIILDIHSIDLLLHITDLISDVCNTEYNNINELNTLSIDVSINYIEKAKNYSKHISLLKRTSYLKFDKIDIFNDKNDLKSETATEKITVNENTVVKNVPSESKADKFTDTVEINKNFDIKEITLLLTMLENTISKSANKTITLSDDEIKSILNVSTVLKNITNDNSIQSFDKANEQFDVIDSFLNTLEEFTENKYHQKKDNILKNNKKEKYISLNKQIDYNDTNELIANSINLINVLNYHQNFNDFVSSLKKDITSINSNINDIFTTNSISDKNTISLLKNIELNTNKTEVFINEVANNISNRILNANLLTNSIYKKLSEMRSKPFRTFTVGLKEYVDVIAESIGKKVILIIDDIDIQITADLWLLFENIIPTVLRHIIIYNFKNNAEKNSNKISISLKLNSGIIDLIFSDNGKFFDEKYQTKPLKDIILMSQNSGGKILVKSNENNGNTIIFRFQMENFLYNYFVLEANKQFYAIPTDFCDQITENNFTETKKIHLTPLFSAEKNNSETEEFIIVRSNSQKMIIVCDKILGIALLAPQRLTGKLSQIPYSIGAAQYGDKSVLLLDVEAIFSNCL